MDAAKNSQHWDAISEGYDDFVQPIFGRLMDDYIDKLELDSESRVLDLACGPGTASLQLHDKVCEIDGLDFADEMVGLFRKKVEKNKITNVRTHVGDGQDLSRFEEDRFDSVISLFGLIFFPDRLASLKEVRRVLKPGGKTLITSWPPMRESSFMSTMFAALIETGMMPDRGENPPDVGFPEPEQFRSEFAETGFKRVEQEKTVMKVPVNDVDQLWDWNVRGSLPIHLLRQEIGEEKWSELSEKALENFRSAVGPSVALEMPAWVWVVS